MIALCPTTSSTLVRKQMKSQLVVTAAIPCLALRVLKRVYTSGRENMGVAIVRSSVWELNPDLCRGLSALSWDYKKPDESASCVSFILNRRLRAGAIDSLRVGCDKW